MTRLVLASRNQHKIEELRRMAPYVRWTAMGLHLGDPPETGATFEENARQKARYVAEATGFWALADDSGLEVDVLGRRPGVFSKRYSPQGRDDTNNELLLHQLLGYSKERRTARYRCVIALVGPGGEFTASGSCEGRIGEAPRGANGFGYDPLFLPNMAPGLTMAELDPAGKDRISHRGAALAQLPDLLHRAGLT